jgi:hypothetical protein
MAGPQCRPILFIPKPKKAGATPFGSGDREGDLGQAVVGLAIPGKAVSHHHHPLRLSIPLPDQDRPGRKLGPLLVEAGQPGGHCRFGFLRRRPIENLTGCVVEIAKAIGLEPIGDDGKQQMPGQMSGGWSSEDALPA